MLVSCHLILIMLDCSIKSKGLVLFGSRFLFWLLLSTSQEGPLFNPICRGSMSRLWFLNTILIVWLWFLNKMFVLWLWLLSRYLYYVADRNIKSGLVFDLCNCIYKYCIVCLDIMDDMVMVHGMVMNRKCWFTSSVSEFFGIGLDDGLYSWCICLLD